MSFDVQFSGSVAAFAADGQFGHLDAVVAAIDSVGLTGVAEQAVGSDFSLESELELVVVAWRHVPSRLGGVPGQRRFDEEPVNFAQVHCEVDS